MQDVMRMAMMQNNQQGMGQGMPMMPGMDGMTPEKYAEMMKRMQMQQMAMQMMQAGRPGAQQQTMPMGLMNFLGK